MDIDKTPEIGVVHLVRARNGTNPFKRFLASYIDNRGGIEHELLIVYKGFSGNSDITEYEQLLVEFPHRSIFVRDVGYDVKSYFAAAEHFKNRYFCFLNSFTILLDKDWLLKMYKYISIEHVGLVGATGSYQSGYTHSVNEFARKKNRPFWKRILFLLLKDIYLFRMRYLFDPFPNPHIRSNAFMISRDTMRKVKCNAIIRKLDAYKFESGKCSLTKQVLAMNLRVLVIGSDGMGYEKEDWDKSNTFWQQDQRNLIIADKQTAIYAGYNLEDRTKFSGYAWGNKANPQ